MRGRPARRRVEKQYTYADAADLLSVSVATVRRWVRQGRLQANYLSGTVARIPQSALADLLDAPAD